MKPVDQTIFAPERFDPNSTVRGNCVQACVASVLEAPLSEVLHCAHMTHSLWLPCLEKHGFAWIKTPINVRFNGYHLICGMGPREIIGLDGHKFPVAHCVVGFNGEIVHDPHPSRAGLTTQEEFWWFVSLKPQSVKGS